MAPDPRIIYKQHLAARSAEIAHREQRHRILGHGKLAMAAFALVLVWMALAQGAFSILWVLIPIAGFTLLVVAHEKLLKELERRRRAARFFEKGLARLDGNWPGTGEPGERYNEASHPYALDLDLFEIRPEGGINGEPSVSLGQQFGSRLFVQFSQDFGPADRSELTFEYRINEFLRFVSTVAQGVQQSLATRRLDSTGGDLIFVYSY